MARFDFSDRYLAVQERFERLVEYGFRGFGQRLVDLSYANPYDDPDEQVIDALRRAIESRQDLDLQYTPYGGKTTTRRLIASDLNGRWGLSLNFRDVILTPGAMAALNIVFRSLFGANDELLVVTPCWIDYPLYLENLGVTYRFVPLNDSKRLDLNAVESALGPNTRGVLLSHPGCPTGVLHSEEELVELCRLLQRAESKHTSRIYLIGDEVHRDIVWGEAAFSSVLSVYPRSVSIYSFGKALFLQGQRIGYVAVSPSMEERTDLREKLRRAVRVMGFCAPTTLMQRAVPDLLRCRPPLDRIRERQERFRALLGELGYRICPAEATFFVYAQSPIPDDMQFAEQLAREGVLVLPSSIFHESGHFRVSLTAKNDAIRSSMTAFEKVMAACRGNRCA